MFRKQTERYNIHYNKILYIDFCVRLKVDKDIKTNSPPCVYLSSQHMDMHMYTAYIGMIIQLVLIRAYFDDMRY